MSLILEALKKSEQQRRLGEAPTLGSPVLAARSGRSLLPLFATLIVIAIAAGWWLLRPAPTVAPAQPGADTATAPPTPPMNRIKPTPAHAAPTRAAEEKREPGKPMASGLEAVAPPLPIAPPVNDRPGSVTQLPPPPAAIPAPPPAVATAAPKSAPAPATPAPATAAAKPPTAATGAPASAATVAQHPVAATTAPTATLPSIWDLPYTTRKVLPDLTLTMHVYTPDPHERFVVIKGERHVEGDELGDGVILREIRADGMVLDYKGTRFVYPRSGG